ncbi:MAG: helix-turn-helix domain-containing protein [Tannerella sp.]|jgi:hypothetical protein|nr:helix-turn-helix domain-containing protein [Tannerella sp.]
MDINNTILSLIENTPDAILKGIADRVKARRLEWAYTQKALSLRSGIPLPTYRRFERTGEISVRGLILLGMALGMTDEFDALFSTKTYSNIDDLLKKERTVRKRGKRNG